MDSFDLRYSEYKFLFPPRPEHVVTSDLIEHYEGRGWKYQYKKNGTSTVITISPKGEIDFRTRHGDKHKAWSCPESLRHALLARVPAKRWTVLVAELLHSKTPTIKDTFFIYDLLVHQSTHLIDVSLEERLLILDGMFPCQGAEAQTHWVLCEGIWRAKTFERGGSKAFSTIRNAKIDEGLVFKDPKAKLKWCYREKANSSWQVKVRYPTKNYQF